MMEHSRGGNSGGTGEVHLFALAAGIVRHWKLVLGVWAAVVLLTVVFVFTRQRLYTAQTVVLPAAESKSGAMALLAEGLPPGLSGIAGAGGGTSNQKMVGAIVASRSLADSVVARLVPASRAGDEAGKAIRLALSRKTKVKTGTDGSVTIRVTDTDAERAARIANEIPVLVNVIISRLSAETAAQRREMLEGQLTGARGRLEGSEQALMRFQQGQAAPEIVEQGRATIQAASSLQQEIIQREVQVAQMRRAMTPNNPQLLSAEAGLNALRGQLRALTSGAGGQGDVFLNLKDSPELKLRAGRLAREFKKDEQIYLSLAASVASAQMDADSRLPVVSTLDPAVVPLTPSSPRPPLALAIAAFLGLLLGLIAAFVAEVMRQARSDPGAAPLFDALGSMRSDLSGIVPGRRGNGRARV